MKRKILGVSLLLLCVCGLFFLRTGKSSSNLAQANPSITAQDEIMLAPAIIDGLTDVVRIPALQSGLIKHIRVQVGETVKKGQILCSLDDSLAKNNILIQKINVDRAKNELMIQEKSLEHGKQLLSRLQSLDKRAVSQAELQEKMYEVSMGDVRVMQAKDNLDLANANLRSAQLTLSQYDIIAPKDGIILQIHGHANEFVTVSQPIMLMGDAKKIIVRVSLDERDASRFDPKAHAFITNTDSSSLKIPLTFSHIDHYIVTQERLNSRVQEVLYYFNREDFPNVIAGQQFEANIPIRTAA